MTTVVAAIIEQDGRILICRRRADQPHPLQWEFPGGKVEADEKPLAAVIRELEEELGIQCDSAQEITRYEYRYAQKPPILLIFFRIVEWRGVPENLIFEKMIWEQPSKLLEYDFLEGDLPFLQSQQF